MEPQHKIIIAGIGPGAKEYVVPAAQKAIDGAAVLVGGSRALREFSHEGQRTCAIKADIAGVMDFIRNQLKESDVVVMVSGDPGYYSLLGALRRSFSLEQLSVIPGISSMQVAFAKVALPWQNADLLSFHGRVPSDDQLVDAEGRIIGMLTDAKFDSAHIASYLIERGWPKEAMAHICSKLSYPEEKIVSLPLGKAVSEGNAAHCVMIVEG